MRPASPARRSVLRFYPLVLILVAALIWGPGLFSGKPQAGDPDAAAPSAGGAPVSVATVVTEHVNPLREFSGRLEAVQSAEIRPQVSGAIVQIGFRDGAMVKQGQSLFTIDPRTYQADLARASGALVAAQAAHANAELEYRRAKILIKTKAISRSEYEAKESASLTARGNLETAEAAKKQAEVNLGYTRVLAPISGKISRAELTEGNVVTAGSNAPLMASIVRQSPIYAAAELDESTFLATIQGVPASKLREIPVEVSLAKDPPVWLPARISSFDNQITPGSGTIRVRALLENKDGTLIPGLFARVRIGQSQAVDALLINPAAISTDQDKKFVFVVDAENKAQYRAVTLGDAVDGLQIVTGLAPGDRVVVSGLQRIQQPGTPVTPQPVDMKTLQPLAQAAPAAPAATPAAPAADAAPGADSTSSEAAQGASQ